MRNSKQTIPVLSPVIFRKDHIKNSTDELLNDEAISQFFIHSLKDDYVKLNLPLPPHRKTVHDFVFISKGRMTRHLGVEAYYTFKLSNSYKLNHSFVFIPKVSIFLRILNSTSFRN